MRQLIWTCVVVWLTGCDIPPEVKLEMACTSVCTCFTTGDIAIQKCVQDCVQDGDLGLVTDDCFECIQAHSMMCTTLEDDCEPLCDMPNPPPDTPDGGMTK